ncbi:MAG: hypothetical protein ACXWB9_02235 [Flavisolibacter sp.]
MKHWHLSYLTPVQNGYRIISIVILLIVALNALAAGYAFMNDPSGNELGIGPDYLKPSAIFDDYLVPGISLFIINGIGSIIVLIMAWRKIHGFAFWIFLQGTVYVLWIIVQLTMVVSFHLLHFIILVAGLALVFCALKLKPRQGVMAE